MNRLFNRSLITRPLINSPLRRQNGVMLLEALIGLMIFSIGILAMIGMQAAAFSAAADAKYRTDAAAHANDIISKIWMNVDRSTPANTIASLNTYAFNTTGDASLPGCGPFSGGAADNTNLVLAAWVSAVTNTSTGMLGADIAMPQINVLATANPSTTTPTAELNKVTVTVCWKAPQDQAVRKHQVITYVY